MATWRWIDRLEFEGAEAVASELAGIAADLGRRFGVADLEMLGLELEGATLVRRARVRDRVIPSLP